jgi:hypothetical protein
VTKGRPPRGIAAVRATPPPSQLETVSAKDRVRFEAIRKAAAELSKVFAAHPTGVPTTKLQRLATPIAAAGKPLTNLGIVDELLETTGRKRDAAVFAAAVIIYERREEDFFDRLVTIGADGKQLRGAPMWRVLRAIKRLSSRVDITPERRQQLIQALRNCARNYDTKFQSRFQTRDIILLVAQTASLKRLNIDVERDNIFSPDQLAEWARFTA